MHGVCTTSFAGKCAFVKQRGSQMVSMEGNCFGVPFAAPDNQLCRESERISWQLQCQLECFSPRLELQAESFLAYPYFGAFKKRKKTRAIYFLFPAANFPFIPLNRNYQAVPGAQSLPPFKSLSVSKFTFIILNSLGLF